MLSYSQHQSNQDFQNPYFRFIYAIKSPETKKRYPDRFKAFLDYVGISGENIEERLINFYNKAKQNPQWLQSPIMSFIIFKKIVTTVWYLYNDICINITHIIKNFHTNNKPR